MGRAGQPRRPTVAQAMRAAPREDFLPPALRDRAGQDVPLPIGHGATSSQPSTVATMLRLLDVRSGQRVLDVGAGSGWTTAVLGWPEGAPYDRILVSAMAPRWPQELVEQLADGGRLLVPLDGRLVLARRRGRRVHRREAPGWYRFVPLR